MNEQTRKQYEEILKAAREKAAKQCQMNSQPSPKNTPPPAPKVTPPPATPAPKPETPKAQPVQMPELSTVTIDDLLTGSNKLTPAPVGFVTPQPVKPKAEAVKPTPAPAKQKHDIEIRIYSKWSFALFGEDTRKIKEELLILGGAFNPCLHYDNGRKCGWIFANKHREAVEHLLNTSF